MTHCPTLFRYVFVAGVAASVLSCQEKGRRGPPRDVVATVNGVALDELDVTFELKGAAKNATPEHRAAIVESMVQDELLRQAAVEEGLDQDPAYLERVRAAAAELKSVQRKELARLLMKKRVAAASEVSVADARSYFDTHASDLRTEVRVFQILRRSKEEIEAAKLALASGKTFEEVAGSGLPTGLPEAASRPWDLGFLSLRSVPEPWRQPLAGLAAGQLSEVIAGPKDRYWILKLIDRRQNDGVTFESTKDAIVESLRAERTVKAREQLILELKAKAKVSVGASSATHNQK